MLYIEINKILNYAQVQQFCTVITAQVTLHKLQLVIETIECLVEINEN